MKRLLLLFLLLFVSSSNAQYDSGRTPPTTFNIGGDLARKNREIGNSDSFNFSLITEGIHRLHINANGDIGIGTSTPTTLLDIAGQIKITGGSPALDRVLTSDADGLAIWKLSGGGGFTDVGTFMILTNINDNVGIGTSSPGNQKLAVRGTSNAATGDGSELIEFRDDRTTTTSAVNYVFAINRQNSTTAAWYLGNDGNTDGVLATNNRNLRIGRDISGVFTEHMRIETGGNVGIGTSSPNTKLEVIGDNPGNVGGFPSGGFQLRGPGTTVNSNAVITGHNSFNGNTQLWYLGNTSSSNQNVALINRQNAELHLHTNDASRFEVAANGDIRFNSYPNTRDDGTPINILGTDVNGNLISGPNEVIHIGGHFVDRADQTIVTVDVPQTITFDTNKLIDDISHTVGSDSFTINTDGVYSFIIAPQLAQGAGAATVEFWIEKNGTNIVDSGVQISMGGNSEQLPLLKWKERLVIGDSFKIIWASDSINSFLDNITSLFGGPNIPSIMFSITHIGS